MYVQDIVRTNLEGALLGAKAAISRMMSQHGGGKVGEAFLIEILCRWW